MNPVHIIGSGLAGSEAAYFLAQKGIKVVLHEMRPSKMTEAHKTDRCAELVCSNSFKSSLAESAPGILKAEMTQIGSLILSSAETSSVPGGQALAVDRDVFAEKVTHALSNHPNITRVFGEVTEAVPGCINLIATGPLTSDTLTRWIAQSTGDQDLYFYDAIAPIIDAQSIDRTSAFLANRYDKGEEEAYLNCPLDKEQYYAFIDALLAAEMVPPKPFEKEKFFQGCQPIEAIAATGRDSLRFGPMKPVGLTDPNTGKRPYAVIQLRPENRSLTAYNMVGFQTKLKWGEQGRIFKMIPALKNAEFLRMGSIHRNTYVCGPKVLNQDLSLKTHPHVFLAGQITGVEGYLESAACGLIAAMAIYERLQKTNDALQPLSTPSVPPSNTALGALLRHVTHGDVKNYQPANATFALFDPSLFQGVVGLNRDSARKAMAEQAVQNLKNWWNTTLA